MVHGFRGSTAQPRNSEVAAAAPVDLLLLPLLLSEGDDRCGQLPGPVSPIRFPDQVRVRLRPFPNRRSTGLSVGCTPLAALGGRISRVCLAKLPTLLAVVIRIVSAEASVAFRDDFTVMVVVGVPGTRVGLHLIAIRGVRSPLGTVYLIATLVLAATFTLGELLRIRSPHPPGVIPNRRAARVAPTAVIVIGRWFPAAGRQVSAVVLRTFDPALAHATNCAIHSSASDARRSNRPARSGSCCMIRRA